MSACASCGWANPPDAANCVHCGRALPAPGGLRPVGLSATSWAVFMVLLIGAILIAVMFYSGR